MAIICWGNLAKSADSTQRIEESIQDYIEGHDMDPNAHMGEDYALGVHRLQNVLDHAVGSIFNTHTYPEVRTYKSIVDIAGSGDSNDIQDAIDYVHGLGGGVILIKNGTYLLSDDLILYSNVELVGEDKTDTILDFQTNEKGVYVGGYTDVIIHNLTIKNSGGKGLYSNNNTSCHYYDLIFKNCAYDLYIVGSATRCFFEKIYSYQNSINSLYINSNALYTAYNTFRDIFIRDCSGSGVLLFGGYNNFLENIIVYNSDNYGFHIQGSNLDGSILIGCEARECTESGFYIGTADRVILQNCKGNNNAGSGIYCEDTIMCSIQGCQFNDNGYTGIDMSSSANFCIIIANQVMYNDHAQIDDGGSGNIVANNLEIS